MPPSRPSTPEPPAALLVFARAPIPGQCKTRLGRRIGNRAAARVQRQLLEHALSLARRWHGPAFLCCSPDRRHAAFAGARREGLVLRRQRGRTLGQRMFNAMTAVHAQGYSALLMGTDCPAMQRASLAVAEQALQRHDPVLIPAQDGGYVLIGSRKAQRGLFSGVRWGDARVLAMTLQRSRRLHLSATCLPQQHDLDDYRDWLRARRAGWLPPLYCLRRRACPIHQ